MVSTRSVTYTSALDQDLLCIPLFSLWFCSFILIICFYSHNLLNFWDIKFEVNPFLSAHIPYAQSEGILPKYGLLQ